MVVLVVARDVFGPPEPVVRVPAPVVEVLPDVRRGLDKTPLLYAEEYVRDLAGRLAPALVRVEDRLGVAASGFVVSDDGELLVALGLGPPPWRVVTGRGRVYEAVLVAADEENGLALLRANLVQPARALEIAPAGTAALGSTLIGLQLVDGAPAVRSLVAPGQSAVLERRLRAAPLEPGEVVVDLDGRLVAFGAQTPLGMRPVPGEALAELLAVLREGRRPASPWTGLHLQTIDETLRAHFPQGAVVVVHVEPGSPAVAAGLREGATFDEIRAGQEAATTATGAVRLIAGHPFVELVPSVRGRAPVRLEVIDRPWPAGFEVATGSFGLAAAMSTGVPIAVIPGMAAALHGLRSGDVIEAVDRRPVTTPQELSRALAPARPHLLTVRREGRWFYAAVDPEAAPDLAGGS